MFDIPVSEQIAIAREIFPDIEEIGTGTGICQATCPGIACHTTGNGARDFRIWFEQGKGPHSLCSFSYSPFQSAGYRHQGGKRSSRIRCVRVGAFNKR